VDTNDMEWNPKHKHDVWNVTHAPRYPHDCSRCKFSWNCAPSCVCQIQLMVKYGNKSFTETPLNVKLWANQFAHKSWEGAELGTYAIPYPELENEA